ncbi:unnamed protein product [Lota lota]
MVLAGSDLLRTKATFDGRGTSDERPQRTRGRAAVPSEDLKSVPIPPTAAPLNRPRVAGTPIPGAPVRSS